MLDVRVYELMAMAEGLQPPNLVVDFDADEEIIVRQFRRMAIEERELFKAIAIALAKIRPSVPANARCRRPVPEGSARKRSPHGSG